MKPVFIRPRIKRTPFIKQTPACIPKFSSHIYCKWNLYSADPSTEVDAGIKIRPFCYTKPVLNRHIKYFYNAFYKKMLKAKVFEGGVKTPFMPRGEERGMDIFWNYTVGEDQLKKSYS